MGQHSNVTRFITSLRATGHSQERTEYLVDEFLNGILYAQKSPSLSNEMSVKGMDNTIGASAPGAPKQKEKELPGVVNEDGWKYEPSATGGPGKKLELFPTEAERLSFSKKPNFGWIDDDDPKFATAEDHMAWVAAQPRVRKDVYRVDKNNKPISKVEKRLPLNNDLSEKSIGRSIRELNPAGGLAQRAARRFGVLVDGLGKFRCPPGTPQANQFTDKIGSTCFGTSLSEMVGLATEGIRDLEKLLESSSFASRGDVGFLPASKLRESESVRAAQKGLRASRLNAPARVARKLEIIDETITQLLSDLNIRNFSPEEKKQGKHVTAIFAKLNEMGNEGGGWTVNTDGLFQAEKLWELHSRSSDPTVRRLMRKLERDEITVEMLQKAEVALLEALIYKWTTNPDEARRVKYIMPAGILGGDGTLEIKAEARMVPVYREGTKLADIKYAIKYDTQRILSELKKEFTALEKGTSYGFTVEGGGNDLAKAAALLEYLDNARAHYASTAAASQSDDPIRVKAAFVGFHEFFHVLQAEKVIAEVLGNEKLKDRPVSEITAEELMGLMKNVGDGIDISQLGLSDTDNEINRYFGGKYAGSMTENSEVQKLEMLSEVGALREVGVLVGDEIDDALSFYDTPKVQRNRLKSDTDKRSRAELTRNTMHKPQVLVGGKPDVPETPVEDGSPKPSIRTKRPRLLRDEISTIAYIKKQRKNQLQALEPEEVKAVERLLIPEYHQISRLTSSDSNDIQNAVTRINRKNRTLVEMGLEPDQLDMDEATVSQQLERTLIPVLTALDKSELRDSVTIRVARGNDGVNVGDAVSIDSVSSHELLHDDMGVPPGSLIVTTTPGTRGIFTTAKDGDEGAGRLIVPPSKLKITRIDADGTAYAEIVDQDSSRDILAKLQRTWPETSDNPSTLNLLQRQKIEIDKSIDVHNNALRGSSSGILGNGRSHPVAANRVRLNNTKAIDAIRKAGGRPVGIDREYADSVSAGLSSRMTSTFGDIETPVERSVSKSSSAVKVLDGLRSLASNGSPDGMEDIVIGEEVQNILDNYSDNEIVRMLDISAFDLHQGFDRRPRVRFTESGLDKFSSSDGMISPKLSGSRKLVQTEYQARMGIHSDTGNTERPVSGFLAHSSHDDRTRSILKRQGIVAGDAPFEYPGSSTPYGNVGADGDIEILLRPEVSGRTSYGMGRGADNKTRPVWMNSENRQDIADALVHVDDANVRNSKVRVLNALTAYLDDDVSAMNQTKLVKPVRNSASHAQDIDAFDADMSGNQVFGAHIMGGFGKDDIAEIRYPWSKVESASKDVDISDVVNKEPLSSKLQRLGFTEEEIAYFYSLNGDSLGSMNTSAMKQLRAYRASKKIEDKYKKQGIPSVSFAHIYGLDMHSPLSYSVTNSAITKTVDGVLSERITKEIDAELEQALKRLQKTRASVAGLSR